MQLLLTICAILTKRGSIKGVADEAGPMICSTITGNAIIQHVAKLRNRRIEAGQPVPDVGTKGRKGSLAVVSAGPKDNMAMNSSASNMSSENADGSIDYDVDKVSDSDESYGKIRKRTGKGRNAKDTSIKHEDQSVKSSSSSGGSNSGSSGDSRVKNRGKKSSEVGEIFVGAGADYLKLAGGDEDDSGNSVQGGSDRSKSESPGDEMSGTSYASHATTSSARSSVLQFRFMKQTSRDKLMKLKVEEASIGQVLVGNAGTDGSMTAATQYADYDLAAGLNDWEMVNVGNQSFDGFVGSHETMVGSHEQAIFPAGEPGFSSRQGAYRSVVPIPEVSSHQYPTPIDAQDEDSHQSNATSSFRSTSSSLYDIGNGDGHQILKHDPMLPTLPYSPFDDLLPDMAMDFGDSEIDEHVWATYINDNDG